MTTSRSARTRTLLATVAIVTAVVGACSGTGTGASPGAAATASAASQGVAPSVAIPDAIIGTWMTTIAEADLQAAGIADDGLLAENAGTFTMTLGQDGTWTSSQEAGVPLRWPVFRGSYIATGPNTFTQTTDFPADYAGDVVDFVWAVEDGALTLKLPEPPDPILPVVMETHPWQRQP